MISHDDMPPLLGSKKEARHEGLAKLMGGGRLVCIILILSLI
jgi:hypothetical protein